MTRYDISQSTEDELLVYMATAAKDRHGVARLMRRYGVSTARDLLRRLPRKRRTPLKARLLRWLQRLEGSVPYDPWKHELAAARRDHKRRRRHGMAFVKMKMPKVDW